MIKTFADKKTHELYRTARSRRFPPEIIKRAVRKLEHLNAAPMLDNLKIPPSNRLHDLGHDRAGHHSISINDQ
ncbi:MAG TPA: plasmid maintenance system killer [Candidatus Latescibacteria bacterium]|nr:plasmid maintenance system killer [Candidatus Latescibacterota bacterium]